MLPILKLQISELPSYGVLILGLSVCVSILLPMFLRIWGLVLAHIMVAITLTICDLNQPNVDPDMIFQFGLFLRIVSLNTILLTVSVPSVIYAVWSKKSSASEQSQNHGM